MDTIQQITNDLSDLNQQLTEELYLWTMKDKNPDFDQKNILNIGRAIHEKTLLIGFIQNENKPEPLNKIIETESSIHFELPEEPLDTVFLEKTEEEEEEEEEIEKPNEHVPVESIQEEIELERYETVSEIKKNDPIQSEVIVQKEIPIADIMMQKGITNMNAVIGISEKFLFIHELFKGDTEKYMSEISRLNEFTNNEVAHSYFAKLTNDMNWDIKSHAFIELKKIITRKYQL